MYYSHNEIFNIFRDTTKHLYLKVPLFTVKGIYIFKVTYVVLHTFLCISKGFYSNIDVNVIRRYYCATAAGIF